jgi:hypothetical protein
MPRSSCAQQYAPNSLENAAFKNIRSKRFDQSGSADCNIAAPELQPRQESYGDCRRAQTPYSAKE